MAIRKEPERRYASARLLGRDIQRHLEGRPVTARPDTAGYRSAKFLRRNRIAVVAGGLIAASLAIGLVAESWLSPRTTRALQVVQLTQTGRVEIGLSIVTDGAWVYFTETSARTWSLARVSVKGGTPLPLLPPAASALSHPDIMDLSPDRSQLILGTGIEKEKSLWVLPAAGGSARRIGDAIGHAAAWSPDGKHIVTARGAALYLVSVDGTDSRKLLDATQEIVFDSIRWAPAGDVLRLAMYGRNTRVGVLWEVAANGDGLHPLMREWTNGAGWPETDSSGRWFPSGKYYLFRSRRGKVSAIWALRASRSWLPRFDRRPVQIYSSPLDFSSLAPSPDGKRVFFPAVQERLEWVRYDAKRRQFTPYLSGIAGRWIDYSMDVG